MKHKKRFHASKKARKAEHMGMEMYERGPVKGEPAVKMHSPAKVHHMKNKFNDESHHDSESYPFGSYMYDRQLLERSRDAARALYRSRGIAGEYYAGAEPRRRQEMADAGMIHEDQRQVANLPQDVKYSPYPVNGPYLPEGIDDTLRGVDAQMDFDDKKRAEHFFPKKY
jgi:hypothetical protein